MKNFVKHNSLFFICLVTFLLLLTVGCNQHPDIDILEIIAKSEKVLRSSEDIETNAASFDGKKSLKFRLMVEGRPAEEEAISLFNQVLDSFEKNSNSKIWDYYNGYFDIKSYDNGVIYEGTKLIGKRLEVVSK